MLDLPPPGHLFDDQLGVHRHRDLGGAQLWPPPSRPAIRPRYSATLLVARPMACLLSASTVSRSAENTTAPYPAGPGIAARSAVGLDDHPSRADPLDPQQDCATLGHRSTSSSAAPAMRGQFAAVDLDAARPAASGPAAAPAPARARRATADRRRSAAPTCARRWPAGRCESARSRPAPRHAPARAAVQVVAASPSTRRLHRRTAPAAAVRDAP